MLLVSRFPLGPLVDWLLDEARQGVELGVGLNVFGGVGQEPDLLGPGLPPVERAGG